MILKNGGVMKKIVTLFAMSIALSGCLDGAEKSAIHQKETCMFSSLDSPSCKEGQLALFVPNSWGNEQLPLYAASVFCNFEHAVVYNNGGVLCVFTGQRIQKEDKPEKK